MQTSIVQGSLKAIADRDGQSLAESFMSADCVVLVDTSGSMDTYDVKTERGMQQRYDVACSELRKLQAQLPGKIAVMSFSSHTVFCPAGIPEFLACGTDMADALDYIFPCDGTGMKLVLISDGQPDDEGKTLAMARKFTSPISVVYVGPEQGLGQAFLQRLAAATGGTYQSKKIDQIADSVQLLLSA